MKKIEIETGVVESINGHQVWFKVGNQTFHLEECDNEEGLPSKESAICYRKMLDIAFDKLDIELKDYSEISVMGKQ